MLNDNQNHIDNQDHYDNLIHNHNHYNGIFFQDTSTCSDTLDKMIPYTPIK